MSTTRKTIEILINPRGQTTVQARGYTGSLCRDATEFIESALGERVSEQLTPDFYEAIRSKQEVEQR